MFCPYIWRMSCFVHTYDEYHVLSIDMMNVMFCPYIWWMPYWVHTYDEYHVLSMHMMNTMFCLYVWRMAYFVHVYDKCHVLSIHMMNAMFCPYIWWMPCFVHTYDGCHVLSIHMMSLILSTHMSMFCPHIRTCCVYTYEHVLCYLWQSKDSNSPCRVPATASHPPGAGTPVVCQTTPSTPAPALGVWVSPAACQTSPSTFSTLMALESSVECRARQTPQRLEVMVLLVRWCFFVLNSDIWWHAWIILWL